MRHDRPYAIPLYFCTSRCSPRLTTPKIERGSGSRCSRPVSRNGYFKVSVGEPIRDNIDTQSNRLGVPLVLGRSHRKASQHHHPHRRGSASAWHSQNRQAPIRKGLSLKGRRAEERFSPQARRHLLDRKVRKPWRPTAKFTANTDSSTSLRADTEVDDANKIST